MADDDDDDDWIVPRLKWIMGMVGISSWDEVRGILKGLLWINTLFDQDGESVFRKLS